MDIDLLLIAAILCCFFCGRGWYRMRARPSGGGHLKGDSTAATTADDLQRRVEVLERIATDRKAALREKFLDLE